MFTWLNKVIKQFQWYDISLIKISTAAFVLMVVKFWPALLALDWYWYLIITVAAAIPPMMKMFCKKG
jgi:hypothetical protein